MSIKLVMRDFFIKNSFRIASNSFIRYSSNDRTNKSWKILRLNHVAIATKSVEESSKLYRNVFNVNTSHVIPMPEHGVNTVFVDFDNTKVELIDPIGGEKSPIWGFLEKNKSGGIHHLCLEVDDVFAAMNDLKDKGIRLLSDEPKIGAHGKHVIFLHPKDCNGVLIELEQC